jgi:AcrR family transcriptional regulator
MFYKLKEKPSYCDMELESQQMDERVKRLRSLEPSNAGRTSYLSILETAAGLFGQFPAKDITLRDILAISGVSNQTLYNYFPSGRDDIAIALYDRFQRTIVENFNTNIRSIKPEEVREDSKMVACLSAGLANAVFGFLKETYCLQCTLFDYLRSHHLIFIASHSEELEAALARELALHFGNRFSTVELPRIVRVCVHMVRGLADEAMTSGDFAIDDLESSARKVLRSLLSTGFQNQDGPSGRHGFLADLSGPFAIVGAPISPSRRQGILERILKRKRDA